MLAITAVAILFVSIIHIMWKEQILLNKYLHNMHISFFKRENETLASFNVYIWATLFQWNCFTLMLFLLLLILILVIIIINIFSSSLGFFSGKLIKFLGRERESAWFSQNLSLPACCARTNFQKKSARLYDQNIKAACGGMIWYILPVFIQKKV